MESRSGDPFSRPDFRRGIELFNDRCFFEAHEVWEEIWKGAGGQERLVLQGLIQIAAGFVKSQRKKPEASRRLLESGVQKLVSAKGPIDQVDLAELVRQVKAWIGSGNEDRDRIEYPLIRNKS